MKNLDRSIYPPSETKKAHTRSVDFSDATDMEGVKWNRMTETTLRSSGMKPSNKRKVDFGL